MKLAVQLALQEAGRGGSVWSVDNHFENLLKQVGVDPVEEPTQMLDIPVEDIASMALDVLNNELSRQ